MTKSLEVRRRQSSPDPITKELLNRDKPRLAWLRTYAPVVSPVPAFAALGFAIAAETLIKGTGPDIMLAVAIVITVLAAIASLVWFACTLDERDKTFPSLVERRRQLALDTRRITRAHAADDKARLPALTRSYARYSVMAVRENTDIKIRVVKHEHYPRWSLIPWTASTTKHTAQASGTFANGDIATGTLTDPDFEELSEAINHWEETARSLEQKEYSEALHHRNLDALAMAMTPPMASVRTRAKIAVSRENNLDQRLLEQAEE